MRFTVYAVPSLIGAILLLGLAVYSYRRRRERQEAMVLTVLLVTVAGWSLAYSCEMMAGAEVKWLWEIGSVILGAWIGPAWLLMALRYTGQTRWMAWGRIVWLLLPAGMTTLLALTNQWHSLVWLDVSVKEGPFLAAVPVYGPWFWFHISMTYAFILLGIVVFLMHIFRRPKLYRRQAGLIIAATLLPILGNGAFLLQLIPVPGLDPGPFLFSISALLLFLAIFRYRFLDLVPVAQRTVLESMQDGVIVLNDQGLIVDLNPAALRMTGLPSDAGVGHQVAMALPALHLGRFSGPKPAHDRVLLESPERRWVDIQVTPLASRGRRFYGQLVVLRDVTVEVELAHMKDDFISTLAHELRAPLTSVLGFARLIQRQFERKVRLHLPLEEAQAQRSAQRIADNLDIIFVEGERLTRLINDVLDLAKIEAGRVEWEMVPLDVSELVVASVNSVLGMAAERDLEVRQEVAAGLRPVHGDADRLAQVLTNLLSNAVKFTERGQVTVSTWLLPPGQEIDPRGRRQPAAETGLPSAQPWVVVSVEDTGVGIAEADLGQIFEKFKQVPGVGDKRTPGTGLGLTICREIVEYHGGHIWAESEVGLGSRFLFTLPVPDAATREST